MAPEFEKAATVLKKDESPVALFEVRTYFLSGLQALSLVRFMKDQITDGIASRVCLPRVSDAFM